MMKDAERATRSPPVYDGLAGHYDRAMQPLERWLLRRLRERALSELAAQSRVLEVGAGTGANFSLYPRGTSGAASELSREMLKLAHGKGAPPGVSLVQTNAERLPFADNSFDAAFATLVFCSLSSPERVFAELRRVVRPDGRVVLLEHVRPSGALGLAFDLLNFFTVRLLDDHFNRRTADDARRAGLELVRVERHALGIVQLIVCRVCYDDAL